MTVLERVERARRELRAAAVAAAVLRGVAVALGLLLLSATADAFVSLPAAARGAVPFVAAAVAAVVFVRRLKRAGMRGDAGGAALWIESRFPSLRYALVTAVDPRWPRDAVPEIERAAATVGVRARRCGSARHVVALAARRTVVAVAAIAVVLMLLIPPVPSPASFGPAASATRCAARTRVAHEPARYGRRSRHAAGIYRSARGIVRRSRVCSGARRQHRRRSRASPATDQVVATLGENRPTCYGNWRRKSGDRWHPRADNAGRLPLAVRLAAASRTSGLLVLEPVPDSAPVVVLTAPGEGFHSARRVRPDSARRDGD